MMLFLIFGMFSLNAQDVRGIHTLSEEPASTPQFQTPKVSDLNASLFEAACEQFTALYDYFKSGIISLHDFLETAEWLIKNLKSPQAQAQLFEFLSEFGISLALAFFVQQILRRWLRPWVYKNLEYQVRHTPHRWGKLILAVALYVLPVFVFGLVLYSTFILLKPLAPVYLEIASIMIMGGVTTWFLLSLFSLFLRPPSTLHYWVAFDLDFSTRIYRLIRRIAIVELLGYYAIKVGVLIKLPYAGHRLLLQMTGLIIILMAVRLVLALQPGIRSWVAQIRRDKTKTKGEKVLASYLDFVGIPLILYIINDYIAWVKIETYEFHIISHKIFTSLALIFVFHALAFILKKWRVSFLRTHRHDLNPKLRHFVLYHATQIDFVIKGLVFVVAAIVILSLWGISPVLILSSEWGRMILERSLSILIIIGGALFAIKSGDGLLSRYLVFEKKVDIDHRQKQHQARYETIHSVSRSILKVVIWVLAILLILGELEVNITPIVATVGVLSVGLSFGVRSLVEDFVTGFFMFLENSFAVGDQLIVNGQNGVLESVTVRILRVRAEDGSLHVFPYGKISTLSNQSREYSVAILMIQVGYKADVDQVCEIIKQTGEELRKIPPTKSWILSSVEINGVEEMTDHYVKIKINMRTKPADQFKVQRAFRRALKKNLDASGIPLPIPQAISYVGQKKDIMG